MTEVHNAADEKSVKKRQDKAKRLQDNRDADLRELLRLPAFRRFIWHLICERCSVMQSPFNPNGSTQTLNIGRQDVGRELWDAIEKIDAVQIPAIMLEYAESLKA